MQPPVDELPAFMERTEREIRSLRRNSRRWRWVAFLLATVWIVAPTLGEAGLSRQTLRLASADTGQEAVFTAEGLVFMRDGEPQLRLSADMHWVGVTGYQDGNVAWTLGTEDGRSAMKMFARDRELRVELAEELLDLGAGLRLYDPDGRPRATFYAARQGTSGLRLTDPSFQPRIDLSAEEEGNAFVRITDSSASNVAELSVIPVSDIRSRAMGGVPEPSPVDPFGPMLYLYDHDSRTVVSSPTTVF